MTALRNLQNYVREQLPFGTRTPVGIDGYRTFALVENATTLTTEVPISYLEDGSNATDHLIKRPISISITISVGDLVETLSPINVAQLRAQATLGRITKYAPTPTRLGSLRESLAQAGNAVRAINAGLEDAVQFINETPLQDFINPEGRGAGLLGIKQPSLQDQFRDKILEIYETKRLIGISINSVPLTNMALTSVVIRQDNQTTDSKFIIEAQQVMITDTVVSEINNLPNASNGTGGKTASTAEKSAQTGRALTSGQTQNVNRALA